MTDARFSVSADDIAVILAEDARVENGALDNIPSYLAVKIATSIEQRAASMTPFNHPEWSEVG